jgi:hypothetical protein
MKDSGFTPANSTSPPSLGGAHMPTTSIRDSSKPESLSLGIHCMVPWIGMRHGHLLFVVSNVAGGINSRSSISRAVEALFPFKCLRAYKRQPSCPLLTTTMYVSPIHHCCGSLSLSSSIIMKKTSPIIKSRADYKIENFL